MPHPPRPAPQGGRLLPGTQPGLLRCSHGPVPARPGRRPSHPGRGAGPHGEAGPRGRHGLPVHLVSITPTPAHAEYYAQSVSRTSSMRRLIDAGNRIVELGYADTDDVETTMRQAEEAPVHRQGRRAIPGLRLAEGHLRPVPAGAGGHCRRTGARRDADNVRVPGPGRIPRRAATGRPGHPGRPSLHGEEQLGRQTWRSTPRSPVRPAASSAWR